METNSELDLYIDSEDAVSRIGGNMSLYKRLLGRFIEGNHYEEIESSLLSGDNEAALRQVHSLKGVSANLSLVRIHSISVQLEQLLKDGSVHSSCMEQLKQAFQATTDVVSQIMAQ